MKVIGMKPELCTECHACEKACAKNWFKTDDITKSCIRIKEKGAGADGKTEIIACNQCGECMPICFVKTIERQKSGVVRIHKKECVGCFSCVGFCPNGAMFTHEDELEPFKCVSCGICVKECPTGAIFMTEV